MEERLSSILTLPYKLLVLALAGFGVYLLIFRFEQTGPGLIVYFAAVAVAYFLIGSYKRVCIRDGAVYVSNYLQEIQLPLDRIERIDGPSWWKTKTPEIVITLRSPSVFGKRIRFAPKYLSASEIGNELRRRLSNQNESTN